MIAATCGLRSGCRNQVWASVESAPTVGRSLKIPAIAALAAHVRAMTASSRPPEPAPTSARAPLPRDAAPHAPLLGVRGLRFSRNDEPVFGPIDFDVDAGQALLVQGDNGAGKTTLLRVLAGLLRPDAGTIRLDGHALLGGALREQAQDASQRSHAMAYLGHLPALKADLSTLENLEFLCGLHGRRSSQTPGGAMAVTGLAGFEDALARQLSAGQKKRLSLARMWLSAAPLWLLEDRKSTRLNSSHSQISYAVFCL